MKGQKKHTPNKRRKGTVGVRESERVCDKRGSDERQAEFSNNTATVGGDSQ